MLHQVSRKLVDFCNKTPDLISEKELEDYFLHRRNVDQWAPATLRIAYSGIKFFFINVLKKDWHIFTYLNAKRPNALPCVLSREEIDQIFKHIETFQNYDYLSTGYHLGSPRLNNAIYGIPFGIQLGEGPSFRIHEPKL